MKLPTVVVLVTGSTDPPNKLWTNVLKVGTAGTSDTGLGATEMGYRVTVPLGLM